MSDEMQKVTDFVCDMMKNASEDEIKDYIKNTEFESDEAAFLFLLSHVFPNMNEDDMAEFFNIGKPAAGWILKQIVLYGIMPLTK